MWKGKGAITKSLKCKAALMRTLKPYLPFNLLCQVGNAIINSTILYCAPIWGPSSKGNRDKVQAAQIRSARIITGIWNWEAESSHRQDLLTSMKWPNVEQLVTISTINLLKNAIDGQSSKGLQEMFKVTKPREASRRQEIRVDHRGSQTRVNNMFSANATHIFNNLPSEIRCPSMSKRKF